MIVAVIQPARLNAVREALVTTEVERMTVCDAQSFEHESGPEGLAEKVRRAANVMRNIVLEIVVNDDFLDRTVAAIENAARTGPEGCDGDGKMWIMPVQQSIQIGPSARGPGAI